MSVSLTYCRLVARSLVPVACLLAAFYGATAVAQVAEDDPRWLRLNWAIVEGHVIPRYEVFRRSTASLTAGVEYFCANPDPALVSWLRAYYTQTHLAWAGIAHNAIGPTEQEQRRWRIQLWPDKHGTATRQMRLLLAAEDSAALAPERFREGSVGVQGLPALERLIYPVQAPGERPDDAAIAEALAPGGQGGYQCALLKCIADNLAEMAGEIEDGWTVSDPAYRDIVRSAGPDNPEIASPRLASSLFLRDLITGLERLAEVQLGRPLGEGIDAARPMRAEAWRSGHSLSVVRATLDSLRHLYTTGFAPLLQSDAELLGLSQAIRRHLDAALFAADGVRGRLAAAVTEPEPRAQVERIQQHVRRARQLLEDKMTRELGLPVGFNSLDGD